MLNWTLWGSKTHPGCASCTHGEGIPTLGCSMPGTEQVPTIFVWPVAAVMTGEVL